MLGMWYARDVTHCYCILDYIPKYISLVQSLWKGYMQRCDVCIIGFRDIVVQQKSVRNQFIILSKEY